jgi:hypothetical protein
MGCQSSRNDLGIDEQRISQLELLLMYDKWNAVDVDLIHRKYSFNGFINSNQLLNISRKLNLGFNNPKTLGYSHIQCFYETFRSDRGYKLQELLVLAIFLAKGNAETKAKLLFEAFDTNDDKELDKYTIGIMHDLMYKISTKRIHILFNKLETNQKTYNDHVAYIKRLKFGREDFRESFLMSVVGDGEKVSLNGFIDSFKLAKNEDILNSWGFRKALKYYSSKNESLKKLDIFGEVPKPSGSSFLTEETKLNSADGDSYSKF